MHKSREPAIRSFHVYPVPVQMCPCLAVPVPAGQWALRQRGGDRVVGNPVGGEDGTRDGGSEGDPVGGTVGPSDQSWCLLVSGLLNMTGSQTLYPPLSLVYATYS